MKTKDKIILLIVIDLSWLFIGWLLQNQFVDVIIGIINMNVGIFYGIYLFEK